MPPWYLWHIALPLGSLQWHFGWPDLKGKLNQDWLVTIELSFWYLGTSLRQLKVIVGRIVSFFLNFSIHLTNITSGHVESWRKLMRMKTTNRKHDGPKIGQARFQIYPHLWFQIQFLIKYQSVSHYLKLTYFFVIFLHAFTLSKTI